MLKEYVFWLAITILYRDRFFNVLLNLMANMAVGFVLILAINYCLYKPLFLGRHEKYPIINIGRHTNLSFFCCFIVPIFKEIFPHKLLHHRSLLVDVISILLKTSIIRSDVVYADKCFVKFVKNVQILYGKEFMSFNVHLLLHLSQSVLIWGPLWAHSAFCYEDFNQKLKNYVKSSYGVAGHIICDIFRIKCVINKLRFIYASFLTETQINYLDKTLYKRNVTKITENIKHLSMLSVPVVSKLQHHYLASQLSLNVFIIVIEQNSVVKYYQRIIIHREIIHSKQYQKVKKRCNYFVILNNNEIFEIDIFLVIVQENLTTCFGLGYYYERIRTPLISHKFRLHHLIVLKKRINNLAAVNVNHINPLRSIPRPVEI